jgi:hypothetical protein
LLIAVVMGEPGLHPDMDKPRRTDRRDHANLVVGALDEGQGLATERPQRFGQLHRRHLGVDAESSQRRSELSSRPARLLFKTEDQLQDRVGGLGR